MVWDIADRPEWSVRAARNVVAAQGGGIQANARIEPPDVRAEATQRAWVALLSAWGDSVGYQGGRNAIIDRVLEAAIESSCWRIRCLGACALTGRTADVARDPYPF